MRWGVYLGVMVMVLGGACGGVTPREHYIEALNLRMDGDSHGYFDKLIYLAAAHSETRPGRRARSILMSTDLGISLGGAIWGAAKGKRFGGNRTSSRRYSGVRKTLETVYLRQSAQKAVQGSYCENFEDCGVKIPVDSEYVYFMGSKAVVGGGGPADPRGLRLDGIAVMSALGVVPIATPDGFLAIAIGNVDHDGGLDVWIVDHSGLLVQLIRD